MGTGSVETLGPQGLMTRWARSNTARILACITPAVTPHLSLGWHGGLAPSSAHATEGHAPGIFVSANILQISAYLVRCGAVIEARNFDTRL